MAEIIVRKIEHQPGEQLLLYPVDPNENLTHQTLDIPDLGQYVVHKVIDRMHGHVSFATLQNAYDTSAPAQMVLKPFTVETDDATPQQAANAFLREYDVMVDLYNARFSIPPVEFVIPRPIGVFEKIDPETKEPIGSYYMTEYFGQHDLTDVVEEGALTPENTLLYFKLLLEQVAAMHKLGLRHRDIKPSNIRITKEGLIGLTDFGTVHRVGDNVADYPIRMISPGYSPFEQRAQQFVPSVTADIFSLGMTLYFMREGNDPDDTWIMPEVDFGSALAGVEVVDEYPPKLRDFMRRMTAYKIEERYQSVDEALVDLQAVIDQGQY